MNVLFFGTPNWAAVALRALAGSAHRVTGVVTSPDAAVGRSRTPQATAVKQAAEALNLGPILQPPSLRPPAVRSEILARPAEIFVVVAYGRILPGQLLDAPPFGAVNLHFSLLPRHRGASPVQHTILCGDPIAGVCTIQMERGLDTGPVLLRREIAVDRRETSSKLGARLAELGAELLVDTLGRLQRQDVHAMSQDETRASQAPLLRPDDGFVHWTETAQQIDRRVRAFDPWPPVICRGPKGVLRLVAVEPMDGVASADVEPGTVLARTGPSVTVAAGGRSVLSLHRVLPAGGREIDAAAALAGGTLALGVVLGDGSRQ